MLKLKTAGTITTEVKTERKGNEPQVFTDEAKTTVIGPFTVNPIHGEVESNVRLVLSESYHSVTVGVSVRIPVDPTDEAVHQGLDYCFATANEFLETETRGARDVLKQLVTRR